MNLLIALSLAFPASAADLAPAASPSAPQAAPVAAPAVSAAPSPTLPASKPAESPSVPAQPVPAAPAPAPAPASAAVPARPSAAAEFAFIKNAALDSDPNMRVAAIDELKIFISRHLDSDQGAEALFLLSSLRQKKGDWASALAGYLRVIHEFPASPAALEAKSAYLELVGQKASRRQRPALNELIQIDNASLGRGERLALLWRRLAEKAPDAIYEPAVEQILDLEERFPDLSERDLLQQALARLHAANDKPQAAVLAWRKLLVFEPSSSLRPQAQLAIGDLYAGSLRDPQQAIASYQALITDYPKAPEVIFALQRSAQLFEDKLKQYGLAVEMNEKIVAGYPKTEASLHALKDIARLQRDRLSAPAEAIKTLQRLSALHGGRDGLEALQLAAKIARRDMSNYNLQITLLRQIAADYSAYREAPEALYDAAGVCESDLNDASRAVTLYDELAAKFPTDKLAKKAASRAAKLRPQPVPAAPAAVPGA